MFKVSRQVEYALIALKHMSDADVEQVTAVRELCDVHHLPFDVISRALQRLAKHGILKSVRGAGGGYRVQGDLGLVTLWDLVAVVDGDLALVPCASEMTSCKCDNEDDCNIQPSMMSLNDRLGGFFKTISVRELLENRSQNPGSRI
jgi:Rrf2 family transcriptional regulator, nitric oxide-sensitive transcriptional repressor